MFIDTSGFLALLDSRERLHALAVQEYERADRLVSQNYVIAELIALINARGLPRARAIADLKAMTSNPLIELIWVDPPLHHAAMNLLQRRADKNYSLCDAVSFLCMSREGIVAALTTDHHFEQEGFVRLLKAG